jgi:hypothetical protein
VATGIYAGLPQRYLRTDAFTACNFLVLRPADL